MSPKAKPPTKTQIAADLAGRIQDYLWRFEADPVINEGYRMQDGTRVPDPHGLCDYYHAQARNTQHRVWIKYIAYHGHSTLTIEEASQYLAWLDEGNVGEHHQAFRELRERVKKSAEETPP
jgi:hypothetical protein